MIVDSSALLAVLRDEPEAAACARALADHQPARISAVNCVESAAVVDGGRGPIAGRRFDELRHEAHVAIEPVTAAQARLARAAYRDFGRGSGHPARLNLGDCFAYALAKSSGELLSFRGGDFRHTDLELIKATS
ncbi:MAG: type II toxin-antitoxin system VapC family toxin [Terriglobales bacterium]